MFIFSLRSFDCCKARDCSRSALSNEGHCAQNCAFRFTFSAYVKRLTVSIENDENLYICTLLGHWTTVEVYENSSPTDSNLDIQLLSFVVYERFSLFSLLIKF